MSPRDPADVRADRVDALLRATTRRLGARDGLLAIALLACAAAVVLAAGWWAAASAGSRAAITVSLVLTSAAGWWAGRSRRSRSAAARAFERGCPRSLNVVITASELLDEPDRSPAWIRARVFADALAVLDEASPERVVPFRRPVLVCVAAFVLAAAAWAIGPSHRWGTSSQPSDAAASAAPPGAAAAATVHATVTPPGYMQAGPQSYADPKRLDAVEGSRLTLEIRSTVADWRVRYSSRSLMSTRTPAGLRLETTLEESGYLAIENSRGGDSRLIPVVVTPDRAPVIRIDAPGKDLLVPDAKRTIAVAAAASDDHGLAALEVRYTKVSGSGEQFAFEEGTMPLRLERRSALEWTGTAALPLGALALEPGDALVYRAVGRDRRTGEAGAAASETFYVEVAGPGQVAVEGVELPPDRERYALSQQMIVLKIQRLRDKERALAPEALSDQTADIAAEQRAVRSNFIFLLGGHVEDEVAEAEHSHEIQEGRLENTARREINEAIQHMSRAEQALAAVTTATALSEAKLAVQALQRAFGRNRYILRTLPVRSRLDPSRRLSGDLAAAGDWARDSAAGKRDPRLRAAHATLGTLLTLTSDLRSRQPAARAALTGLAEQALQVAPAEQRWQDIAAAMLELRQAIDGAAPAGALDASLQKVLSLLSVEARRGAIAAQPHARGDDALRSAWAASARQR